MRISRFEFSTLQNFHPGSDMFEPEPVAEAPREEPPPPPPPPSFSQAELEAAREAARQEGYDAGVEAGLAQAQNEAAQRDQDALHLLAAIEAHLGMYRKLYTDLLAAESADLGRFIITAARKVAGEAMARAPELAAMELVNQCLPILLQKPRVTIEAHPQTLSRLETHLTPVLARAGFEGEAQFRTNDALASADVTVEWKGGRASRESESLWREIETMIDQIPFATSLTSTS